MRDVNIAGVMRRMNPTIASWLLAEEGRNGLERIGTTLRLMVALRALPRLNCGLM